MSKILIVTGSLYNAVGGPYHSVKSTALAFRDAGLYVEIIGTRDQRNQLKEAQAYVDNRDGINVRALSKFGPYNLHFSFAFVTYWKAVKSCDAVSIQGVWMFNCIVIAIMARILRKPYYCAIRGEFNSEENLKRPSKKILKVFVREVFKGAEFLQILNKKERIALREYGYKGRIVEIANGIKAKNLNLTNKRAKQVLYLGRLHPMKGVENLIEAWSSINDTFNWELIIVGDGEDSYKGKIKELIRDSKTIHYLGPKFGDEKNELLRCSSWFILPSFREGMPMAVLEALSYGTPVMITNECNLDEVITRKAGYLISNDKKSLLESFQFIFGLSEYEYFEYQQNTTDLVKESFDWDVIIERLLRELHFVK